MFIKLKRLNKWLRKNFPGEKNERRYRSVAEGLDKVEELKAIGEDLENISLELKKSTNQNRRISRHTSDISHRLGRRAPFRQRNDAPPEEDFIKARLEEIRQISLRKQLNEQKKQETARNGSPLTGMLKFAKNPPNRACSMLDLRVTSPVRTPKRSEEAPDLSDISGSEEETSSVSGSDSGLSMTSDTVESKKKTKQKSDKPKGPRPNTPFIDRKVCAINKRFSMIETGNNYRTRYLNQSESDLSTYASDQPTQNIKMHVIWNGIVV